MKEFHELTIAEMLNLSDQDIEKFAPVLGKEYIEKNREKIELEAGRKIIRAQIKKLKDLMSE